MEDFEAAELGAAVDEDEELLAEKKSGYSTGGSDGGDQLTENVSLN